jgi:hypothetical protein
MLNPAIRKTATKAHTALQDRCDGNEAQREHADDGVKKFPG